MKIGSLVPPDIPKESWESAWGEIDAKFVRIFAPEADEKNLYKEILLGLASLDPERTKGAIDSGAEELLKKYDPESNSFGIHALIEDLHALRLKIFAVRSKEEFFRYMRFFVVFAERFISLDPNVYAKRSPYWGKFIENGKRALWIRMYRTVLQEMPFSLRRALEPLVRRVADYYVYEMEVWAREDLSLEEKDALLDKRYREEREIITNELKKLGLSPNLLDPRGRASNEPLPPWEKKPAALRKEEGGAGWIF